MSVKVLRKDLTKEQIEDIRKSLTIIPQGKEQWNTRIGAMVAPPPGNPINYYLMDDINIWLPFKEGARILQRPVNLDLPHSNIILPLEFTGKLFDNQVEVMKEVEEQLNVHGTTSMALYTAFGKTICATYLITKVKKYTLVLIPITTLNDSWFKDTSSNSNLTVWVVPEEKDMKTNGPPKEQPHVIICYYERLGKIPQEWLKTIGHLVIDEGHLMATRDKIFSLLCVQPQYICVLTATFMRDDGLMKLITCLVGEHRVERINTKPFSVIKVVTGFHPENLQRTARGLDWSHALSVITSNEARNKYIVSLVMKHMDKKILILTERNEHVIRLTELLAEVGETSVDSLMKSKKIYKDSRILIGGVKKTGTGFNPNDKIAQDFDGRHFNMLILTTSVKNLTALEQRIGRVMRVADAIVYHLVDDIGTVKKHFVENKKWYLSRGAIITTENPKIIYDE